MKKIDRKQVLCFLIMVFDIFFITSKYVPFMYENIFGGVEFNGYVLFYASSILYLAVYIFWGFEGTEKYVTGYGLLEITRTLKREKLLIKIIKKQFLDSVYLMAIGISIYMAMALFLKDKIPTKRVFELRTYILVFLLVMINLKLWQSIFEAACGSRVAIILLFGIIILHIGLGDLVYLKDGVKGWYFLLYTNLALFQRNKWINISDIISIIYLLILCFFEIIILYIVLKRKNIYS